MNKLLKRAKQLERRHKMEAYADVLATVGVIVGVLAILYFGWHIVRAL